MTDLPVVSATIRLDLTTTPTHRRRLELDALKQAPHGTRVELIVGVLRPYDVPDAIDFLGIATMHASLAVDVHGDMDAVGVWVDELRDALRTSRPRLVAVGDRT